MIRQRGRGGRLANTLVDDDVVTLVRRLLAARHRDGARPLAVTEGGELERAWARAARRHRQVAALETAAARFHANRGDAQMAAEHSDRAARERVLAETEELVDSGTGNEHPLLSGEPAGRRPHPTRSAPRHCVRCAGKAPGRGSADRGGRSGKPAAGRD